MSVKILMENELKSAMKMKDTIKKNSLRMALSSIKLAEVESREELDDSRIFAILQKEIKTKEETISEAKKAGREEMRDEIEKEILVLKEFLPKELSKEEIYQMIDMIIKETGAETIKDMGKVMKEAIQRAEGRASNDKISGIVREKLSES